MPGHPRAGTRQDVYDAALRKVFKQDDHEQQNHLRIVCIEVQPTFHSLMSSAASMRGAEIIGLSHHGRCFCPPVLLATGADGPQPRMDRQPAPFQRHSFGKRGLLQRCASLRPTS